MIRMTPLAGLVLVAHAVASCSDSKPVAASAPPPPPVTVARPLQKTITECEFDSRRATERDAAGQVSAAEAALKQAELNLEWTEVRAPITGRISDRRVDPGNLITGGPSGATLLTVIVSIDPIHFVFDG